MPFLLRRWSLAIVFSEVLERCDVFVFVFDDLSLDEISILIDEALQSSVVCVVTAESPKPSITVGGGFSVDVVKFPVVFRWSNDLVCSGLSMKTVEARVPV